MLSKTMPLVAATVLAPGVVCLVVMFLVASKDHDFSHHRIGEIGQKLEWTLVRLVPAQLTIIVGTFRLVQRLRGETTQIATQPWVVYLIAALASAGCGLVSSHLDGDQRHSMRVTLLAAVLFAFIPRLFRYVGGIYVAEDAKLRRVLPN
jgi:hypothetical protein